MSFWCSCIVWNIILEPFPSPQEWVQHETPCRRLLLPVFFFFICEQLRMWATLSPVGSSVSLDWLKPSEQKYPHACVFSAAWGNVIMPRLIRLTLTIPQGKSLHICNGQIITLPQMFVSSFFVCVLVLALATSVEDHQWFLFVFLCVCRLGWAPFQCVSGSL